MSIADHAADAGGLLDHLGVRRAHVAGHSNSGPVVLQLALDRPEVVHTLTLLEPALFTVPSADAFFKNAGPSLEAYGAGDHERAVAGFLSAVSGLDWEICQAVLDEHVPGGIAQGYSEWGDPYGQPLLYCHGWPGSRAEGQFSDQAAKAHGVRLIAPDRPVMGQSDFQPRRDPPGPARPPAAAWSRTRQGGRAPKSPPWSPA